MSDTTITSVNLARASQAGCTGRSRRSTPRHGQRRSRRQVTTARARARRRRAAARGKPPLQGAWRRAIGLLMDDLALRDAAERTRRAYSVDLEQFAQWAGAQGQAPREVGPKAVRRYIAHLSERGAAPSTSARKLAALRALFSSQREHGEIAENPADLVSTPRRPLASAARAQRARSRRPARRHPRPAGRSSCATARCSSSPTPAACAPRSSSR